MLKHINKESMQSISICCDHISIWTLPTKQRVKPINIHLLLPYINMDFTNTRKQITQDAKAIGIFNQVSFSLKLGHPVLLRLF